jgi:molybdopterin synthase catalytic subunit
MPFVTHAPIDVPALLAEVARRDRGGTVVFLGSVRRSEDDGPVEAIEYTAYEEMAEAEFGKIVAEAEVRWPDAGFAVRHRLGEVLTGEPSIAVAAAAAHRAEAFDAAHWVVEEAKRRLPIWKRERFDDGSRQWRDGSGVAGASDTA